MKKKSFIPVLILLAGFTIPLYAQDVHFSQYDASPLSLNPANTGNFDGDWRFSDSYRNQWKALSFPFRTLSSGFDRQFYLFNQNLAGGLLVINDKSGPAGLTVNSLYLSFAWHIVNGRNQVLLGIQTGMVFKTFSSDGMTFPSQFDMTTGQYNSHLNNDEDNFMMNIHYPDLNIGVVWNKQLRFCRPEAGIAFFHLTQPNESFFNSDNHLPVRTSVFGSCTIPVSNFYMRPQALFMYHDKAREFTPGIITGINLGEKSFFRELFAGLMYRFDVTHSTDAALCVAGVQLNRLRIGLSYDINVSSLQVATNRKGAFEFSLIYITRNTRPNKMTIPCTRI